MQLLADSIEAIDQSTAADGLRLPTGQSEFERIRLQVQLQGETCA